MLFCVLLEYVYFIVARTDLDMFVFMCVVVIVIMFVRMARTSPVLRRSVTVLMHRTLSSLKVMRVANVRMLVEED